MRVPQRKVVEARVEYAFQCPKCGKWCSSNYKIGACNKCAQKVTLVVPDEDKIK